MILTLYNLVIAARCQKRQAATLFLHAVQSRCNARVKTHPVKVLVTKCSSYTFSSVEIRSNKTNILFTLLKLGDKNMCFSWPRCCFLTAYIHVLRNSSIVK